jgi:hypothetical protein
LRAETPPIGESGGAVQLEEGAWGTGKRQANGYRVCTDADRQRLHLM